MLQIGNDVSIGCGAAIAAFQHIRVGDGTKIGPFVIIMDTNFHGAPGDQTLRHDCRPVIIGNRCQIGSRVTITRGAIIGDDAEILAGSVVASSIPQGVCAAGARARIIGRAGDIASRWESAAAALPAILMRTLNLASPPDLDNCPIPAHARVAACTNALLVALEDRFGFELDRTVVDNAETFADMAVAVQHALLHRQRDGGPR